jgi:hypothetical protein
LNTAANDAAQANTFRSRVPDFGDSSLIPALRKQHVVIDVTSSSSWTRLLAGIPLPMLLFLGFILIAGIVRLAQGTEHRPRTFAGQRGVRSRGIRHCELSLIRRCNSAKFVQDARGHALFSMTR